MPIYGEIKNIDQIIMFTYYYFKIICKNVNFFELHNSTSKKVLKYNQICLASLFVQ